MNATSESGIVTAGWRLLWHTQRALWWVFAVNLVLGLFSAAGLSVRLSGVLDHSRAAEHLYHRFDLAYFLELAMNPEVQLASRPMSSLAFAGLFFVFMLFATGGILDSYARNRNLVPGEFFQGCGAFFWRFVRLLLWLCAVLIPIALLTSGLVRWSSYLSEYSPHEKLGFWVLAAGSAFLLLLLMSVRLWFDMAQVRAVIEDEHAMTRTLARALKHTLSNFAPLFWMYFRVSLLAWAGTAAALYFWVELVPPDRIGQAFLVAQFVAWLWIATRLWQRASEVVWYQRQRPAPAPIVMDMAQDESEVPSLAPQRRSLDS